MIYPKNPYCPFDKEHMCPDGGNNGNNTGGNGGNCNMGNDCNNGNGTGNNNGNTDTGNMNQNELMQYISELEFALTDLNLYLDTHPDNAEALEMFTKLAATLKSIKADYAKKYAPICAMDAKNNVPFEWVSAEYKWPWQV